MDLCTDTDDLYDLHSFAGNGRVPHAEDFIRTSKQIGCPTLMGPQDLNIRTSVKVLPQLVLDATQIPRAFGSNVGRPSHFLRHPSTRGAGLHAPDWFLLRMYASDPSSNRPPRSDWRFHILSGPMHSGQDVPRPSLSHLLASFDVVG